MWARLPSKFFTHFTRATFILLSSPPFLEILATPLCMILAVSVRMCAVHAWLKLWRCVFVCLHNELQLPLTTAGQQKPLASISVASSYKTHERYVYTNGGGVISAIIEHEKLIPLIILHSKGSLLPIIAQT